MNNTTAKRMNLHLQKGGRTATFQMPSEMERFVKEITEKKQINFSGYVKYAINNQLEHDLAEITNK